ncbi:MAG: hypothetical protein MJK12_14645 [Colwellia sp.]|nr:hypothetical protein [Colwellia sp.]
MINSIGNNSYFIQPSSPSDFISHETQNKLQDSAQVKVDESAATIKENKNQQWQLMLAQSYVDTQKAAVNAYMLSATGETLYDGQTDDKQASTITGVYDELLNEYLQAKYESLPLAKPELANDELVNIQPMPYQTNEKTQQYMSIQRPTENSLLHLSA